MTDRQRTRIRWHRQGLTTRSPFGSFFEAKEPEEWRAFDSGSARERTGPNVGMVVRDGSTWRARSFPPRTRRFGEHRTDPVDSVHLMRGSAFAAVEERYLTALGPVDP